MQRKKKLRNIYFQNILDLDQLVQTYFLNGQRFNLIEVRPNKWIFNDLDQCLSTFLKSRNPKCQKKTQLFLIKINNLGLA